MTADPANDALLESWELHMRSPLDGTKPRRERTVELYLSEVRRFVGWLSDHGRLTDLERVERDDFVVWIADLRQAGLATSTIRSRWIALRALYRWAYTEEIIERNPMVRVVVPRAEEPPPNVLSDDQLRALLKHCQGTRFVDRRDFALIRFMLSTGLRAAEVCKGRLVDLDLMTRVAVIDDGKGGKARVVRFDPTTAAALDRYKRARGRHRQARMPQLWLGHRGPLLPKGVASMLARRGVQAGIGHVHPHQLRHTWAHRMKKAGVSDESAMALGGWSDSTSLRRYGEHLRVERALAAYDEADPMAGL